MIFERCSVAISCAAVIFAACNSGGATRRGPLAALADSVLPKKTSSAECRRFEHDMFEVYDPVTICVARVSDTTVTVTSSEDNGRVRRVVRTWGDTNVGRSSLDAALAKRLTELYGTALPYDGSGSGLRWPLAAGRVLLLSTGRGSEQQLIFVSEVPKSGNARTSR